MTNLDLPPMQRCKRDKKGRHDIAAIIPGEDSGDVTFYCEMCGALRRVPASGAIGVALDDMTGAYIKRVVQGGG